MPNVCYKETYTEGIELPESVSLKKKKKKRLNSLNLFQMTVLGKILAKLSLAQASEFYNLNILSIPLLCFIVKTSSSY